MHKISLKRISSSGLGITLLLSLSLLAPSVQAQHSWPDNYNFRHNVPKTKPDISFTDPTNGASDCLTGNNITHYEKCSPAGELERQALYRSPFFGLLMIFQKMHNISVKMNDLYNKKPLTPYEYEKFISMEVDLQDHAGFISFMTQDLFTVKNMYVERYNRYHVVQETVKEHFQSWYLKTMARSCYQLRTFIVNELRYWVVRDKGAGNDESLPDVPDRPSILASGTTEWFNDTEKEIVKNIIGYTPKWWEHTDLGFACKLLIEETKDLIKINRTAGLPGLNDIPHGISYTFGWKINRYSGRWPNGEAHFDEDRKYSRHTRVRIANNTATLEKVITTLKKILGLEILEARAHFNGPLNKICSPHTDQHYVTKAVNHPSSPDWHRVFSSAVLDTTQYPTTTYPVHNILLSAHPSQNYSSDEVKKHLMTKDPRYITFYSSTPNPKEGYYPGLPMIFVPGTDYVPPALLSGGITVYAYPPAVCTKNTDSDLPIRIFN